MIIIGLEIVYYVDTNVALMINELNNIIIVINLSYHCQIPLKHIIIIVLLI